MIQSRAIIPESRRKPQQARASVRREKFLDVAADLIAQSGYETVTMTAIAEKAHASIGTLYDYFPDKPSLALALLARFTEQADAHWKRVLVPELTISSTDLAAALIEGILAFVRQHPAYLALMDAPMKYARTDAARRPLRKTIARALNRMHPARNSTRAILVAEIIVALLKSFLDIYRRAAPREKAHVEAEFKGLMRLYLMDQFGSGPVRAR